MLGYLDSWHIMFGVDTWLIAIMIGVEVLNTWARQLTAQDCAL